VEDQTGLNQSAKEAMLSRLSSVGAEVVKSESLLFGAKRERDREIKIASELGISRREVADAVGLTAAGIQKIVSHN
jgi:hypothetical protein